MSKYQCWLIEQIMNSGLIHLIKSQLCQTNQTKELPDDVAKIPLNIDDNRKFLKRKIVRHSKKGIRIVLFGRG